MAKGDQVGPIVCTMPHHAGAKASRMAKAAAGEIADAITLIETGRVDQAVTRLRLLLKTNGHPTPAPPGFQRAER